MSDEQKPRDFVPVDDAAEAKRLLREATKSLASTIIWTRNQEHVLNTHLTHQSESTKEFYAGIPRDFNAGRMIDEMKKLAINECFFSVSLTRAIVFFKA